MSGPVASGEEDESFSVSSAPSWKKSAGVPALPTLLPSVLSGGVVVVVAVIVMAVVVVVVHGV